MKTNIKNIILLVVRILVGGMLVWAGYMKLMDMDKTIGAFSQYFGLSSGITWAVSVGELLAGLGLVFGVWTRLAAVGSAIIMAGAVYYTKGQAVDVIVLLVASLVLLFVGGGKWALITCKPKA
jgi:uncharacterized membrane protein YphA (DoxX/SURF4 family)